LRPTLSRLLRLLPAARAADEQRSDLDRSWSPIGALSGLAERLGGAVSETIGIDVDAEADAASGGNGERPSQPRTPAAGTREDAP
jgi:hypothetical protein